MRIHIISIGGRIMHTLGILLKKQGHHVSGSDDEIYDPSKSKLQRAGLLPEKEGWYPENININIDLIILGMHARKDNPELLKSKELGLKILSYPEFIYEQTKDAYRIVIAGSHGKTTTVSMILHVLKYRNIKFDYLVGAELEGFDEMLSLKGEKLAIIEGDEYLSSPIDPSPKIFHYNPDLTVITGIAWDHINVFKTEEGYNTLFETYIQNFHPETHLIWYGKDKVLSDIVSKFSGISQESYFPLESDRDTISFNNKRYRIKVFGEHNRSNMMAALKVCLQLGISAEDFFAAISTFKGASKRLEILFDSEDIKIFRDFAHAPSKVKASVLAVKEQFPDENLILFLELHTYSSLNKDFLPFYKDSLNNGHKAVVFYSPHTLKIKKMPELQDAYIKKAFNRDDLIVIEEKNKLESFIQNIDLKGSVILMMSSGNFQKTDILEILQEKL